MAKKLRVKNWQRFQHYNKRNPPWIRLYNELLDDYAFSHLPDAAKYHAVGLWLLASRFDNSIPDDAKWIGLRINATEPVDIPELLSTGFLERYDPASEVLADCKQSATPEQSRAEQKTEKSRADDVAPTLDNDVENFVSSAIIACNRGMIDNPQLPKARPIDGMHPTSRQAVFDWLHDGISRDVITLAVYSVAKTYKPSSVNPQINSLSYCNGAVRREWDARKASSTPVPPGTMKSAKVELDPTSEAAEVSRSQPRNNDKYRTERYEPKSPASERSGMARIDGFDPVKERKRKEAEDRERASAWARENPNKYEKITTEVAQGMARDFMDAPASVVKATGEDRVLKRILAELTPKIADVA